MLVVHSEDHARHEPRHFLVRGTLQPSAEQPERARRLLAAARAGSHEIVAPDPLPAGAIERVHAKSYVDFLRDGPAAWAKLPDASPEIIPNIHPGRLMSGYPSGIVGRAGWHMADTACPIGPGTYAAAVAAASCAVHATRAVLEQDRAVAYALCRPPGHHAYADMAGGFCYLNNVAIAAEFARRSLHRVAILDVDVHHGNGTQGIFYDWPDVLVVSIHADPSTYYPFFAGYADERGEGAGEGANLNLPLPHGTGDAGWLAALDRALATIAAYEPEMLFVSLGFDASEHDPLGVLKVSDAGFGEIAARTAELGLPTVLVQEGGYLSDHLGGLLERFLGRWEATLAAG